MGNFVRLSQRRHGDAGRFPAYAPGSHEFVVVESGTLRLTLASRTVDLDAGDSVYFAADVTHGYANPARMPCAGAK